MPHCSLAKEQTNVAATAMAREVSFFQDFPDAAVWEQALLERRPSVEPAPGKFTKSTPQVTLEFCSHDGNSATLRVVRRPVGLTFDLTARQLTVKYVVPLSPPQDAGVQIKMVLTNVDGEPLADKTTEEAWQKVKMAVGKLPVKNSLSKQL